MNMSDSETGPAVNMLSGAPVQIESIIKMFNKRLVAVPLAVNCLYSVIKRRKAVAFEFRLFIVEVEWQTINQERWIT